MKTSNSKSSSLLTFSPKDKGAEISAPPLKLRRHAVRKVEMTLARLHHIPLFEAEEVGLGDDDVIN